MLALLGAIILGAAIYINSLLPIITGYAAKNLCSAVFISGREPSKMLKIWILIFHLSNIQGTMLIMRIRVSPAGFLWGRSKAIYRDGFGTTLLRDVKEEDLRKIRFPAGTDPGYHAGYHHMASWGYYS